MLDQIEVRRSASALRTGNVEWTQFDGRSFEIRVLICPASEGGFFTRVVRLPGVVSEGATMEEALENTRDAFQAAAELYLDESGAIPWSDDEVERPKDCRPQDCIERRIRVDV